MESILIIVPAGYETKLKSRIPSKYRISEGASGTTVIDDGATRIYLLQEHSAQADLEDSQHDTVRSKVADPVFYSLEFSDITFCRDVLMAIADDPEVLVDNDHGVLLPGCEFVRVLRSQADWDWRRDRP